MKNSNPKVSIISPMYNVEKYLDKCIRSYMSQTLKDIEIIMIDDGSPDNSGEIADEYAKKDNRIKVIHKKNGGVSAARNDGLKVAKGEYVIFCDSDDWMDEKACEILYNAAERNNADISIGDVYMAFHNKNEHVNFYKEDFNTDKEKVIKGLIKADINRTYCENPHSSGPAFGYGGPWNKLVRKTLLTNNKITFDVRTKGVFDDIIYTAYILANADRVCYTSYPIYYYRQVEESITNSFKANTLEINDAIFNSWNDFFSKHDKNNEYLEAYHACVIRRLVESMRLYFINKNNPKTKKELKNEYINIIKKEPYYSAIKNVKIRKLNKKQKTLTLLTRLKMVSPLWIIFKKYYNE